MSKTKSKKPGRRTKKSTQMQRRTTPILPFEPEVRPDAVDVVGVLPGDVHVDPELTEGHAGYDESGDSELTQHL